MSLAGGGAYAVGMGPCTEGEQDPALREEPLYGQVQCIMGYGHMGPPSPMWTDRLTDTHNLKHYIPATSLAGGNYQIDSWM